MHFPQKCEQNIHFQQLELKIVLRIISFKSSKYVYTYTFNDILEQFQYETYVKLCNSNVPYRKKILSKGYYVVKIKIQVK